MYGTASRGWSRAGSAILLNTDDWCSIIYIQGIQVHFNFKVSNSQLGRNSGSYLSIVNIHKLGYKWDRTTLLNHLKSVYNFITGCNEIIYFRKPSRRCNYYVTELFWPRHWNPDTVFGLFLCLKTEKTQKFGFQTSLDLMASDFRHTVDSFFE